MWASWPVRSSASRSTADLQAKRSCWGLQRRARRRALQRKRKRLRPRLLHMQRCTGRLLPVQHTGCRPVVIKQEAVARLLL